MADTLNLNLDYERPLKIADDVYWIGFYDSEAGLHCNPYLIVDNGEAVIIDSGSRPDFPTVMMKVLQTGIAPAAISALIYHHYDPDLCAGIPNFEDIIARGDLKIISDSANHMFIRHYGITSRLYSLEELGHEFRFSSGRRLRFINTPHAHLEGSFITFDEKTGILFTADLFGSYSREWNLFFRRDDHCRNCTDVSNCPRELLSCPIREIMLFHRKTMPSESVLRYAMGIIRNIPCTIIAPQHGSVIVVPEDIVFLRDMLGSLTEVGIDGVIKGKPGAGDESKN